MPSDLPPGNGTSPGPPESWSETVKRLRAARFRRDRERRSRLAAPRREQFRTLTMEGSREPLTRPRSEYWTVRELADRKECTRAEVVRAISAWFVTSAPWGLPAERNGMDWLIHFDDARRWQPKRR
jgi:hypothetical protein